MFLTKLYWRMNFYLFSSAQAYATRRWYTQSAACKSDILYYTLPSTMNPHWFDLLIQHCLIDVANLNVSTLTPSKFLFFEELVKLISLLQNKCRSQLFKPSADILSLLRLIVEVAFEKFLHLKQNLANWLENLSLVQNLLHTIVSNSREKEYT